MLLSKHLMDQVSHYHDSTIQKQSWLYTQVTIYYKSWWKKSEVYDFRMISLNIENSKFETADSCDELIIQLQNYIPTTFNQPIDKITNGDIITVDFRKDD